MASLQRLKGGSSSLGVKVTDSWPACPEFKPDTTGTAEVPLCRGEQWTLNMSRLKHPPVGMVWKLERGRGTRSDSVFVI
ncbi:hypothetical protein TNCV_1034091 [Trichonephila clavipes]|nr:hypothetical protein TNCV_1034091 [Trichonephila clavipes]